jgi:hypothetical protein
VSEETEVTMQGLGGREHVNNGIQVSDLKRRMQAV